MKKIIELIVLLTGLSENLPIVLILAKLAIPLIITIAALLIFLVVSLVGMIV